MAVRIRGSRQATKKGSQPSLKGQGSVNFYGLWCPLWDLILWSMKCTACVNDTDQCSDVLANSNAQTKEKRWYIYSHRCRYKYCTCYCSRMFSVECYRNSKSLRSFSLNLTFSKNANLTIGLFWYKIWQKKSSVTRFLTLVFFSQIGVAPHWLSHCRHFNFLATQSL